ncbi:hypothetical protein [Catenulispora rubra]|uniref:hypothetical protein n=1 Tax=Catenulispora rubra TaxID=280293 RepID=UPI00189283B6|nr:hypothetical protein [Catenulispora rubra]
MTQTPLRVSTHPLYLIDLAGDRPMLACPACRTWLVVADGMLPPHRSDHQPDQAERDKTAPRRPRCVASRRPVVLDLSPSTWSSKFAIGVRDAGMRRGNRVFADPRSESSPQVPVPTPVFRLRRA